MVGGAILFIMTVHSEILTYSGIIVCIGCIFLLFNKRIRTSLLHTREAEDALTKERDSLERRISERTEELLYVEKQRYQELERVAHFGELSQGLFHDLMSPLSSISLYLERIHTTHDTEEVRDIISKTAQASRRMNSFMQSIRKSINIPEKKLSTANFLDELSIVKDMLMYKARMAGTKICINKSCFHIPIRLRIHPVRIQQLCINLISNAIDACEYVQRQNTIDEEQSVTISVSKENNCSVITITDTGCGIPPQHISNIWKQSFTTKPKGTGMGLFTVKGIVEDELHGSISVKSDKDRGTAFTISIPHTHLA